MDELKFNSQICTTKEQSQRLLELGLSPYTSDMCWLNISDLPACAGYTVFKKAEDEYKLNVIPAWSLHRLLEMLDIYVEYSPYTGFNHIGNNSLYDDLINLVEDRIIKKLFNKEYLKQ